MTKAVLKIFSIFTGKCLCWSINFIEKRLLPRYFLVNNAEFFLLWRTSANGCFYPMLFRHDHFKLTWLLKCKLYFKKSIKLVKKIVVVRVKIFVFTRISWNNSIFFLFLTPHVTGFGLARLKFKKHWSVENTNSKLLWTPD